MILGTVQPNHAREFVLSGVPQIEQSMGKKTCSCGMQ
jgi:hypothetical protein